MLVSAYAAAKVYVLPSYSEVMPLTVYEAAAAGCRVITSTRYPVASEIANFVVRIDPDDVAGLRDAICKEMQAPDNQKLKEAARSMPSWGDVAKMIVQVYEKVLSRS